MAQFPEVREVRRAGVRSWRIFLKRLTLVGAAWYTSINSALADTHTWSDAAVGNSNWSDGGNWSPTGPPAFGDFVIVPAPGVGVGPVVVNTLASVANMEVGSNGSTPQVQVQAGRDLVINAGDPDDEAATAAMLHLSSQDNVHTSTVRAFDSSEIEKVIGLLVKK